MLKMFNPKNYFDSKIERTHTVKNYYFILFKNITVIWKKKNYENNQPLESVYNVCFYILNSFNQERGRSSQLTTDQLESKTCRQLMTKL